MLRLVKFLVWFDFTALAYIYGLPSFLALRLGTRAAAVVPSEAEIKRISMRLATRLARKYDKLGWTNWAQAVRMTNGVHA